MPGQHRRPTPSRSVGPSRRSVLRGLAVGGVAGVGGAAAAAAAVPTGLRRVAVVTVGKEPVSSVRFSPTSIATFDAPSLTAPRLTPDFLREARHSLTRTTMQTVTVERSSTPPTSVPPTQTPTHTPTRTPTPPPTQPPSNGIFRSALAPQLPLATTPGWHLARRVAFAPTAELAAEIERTGTASWIRQQLNPSAVDDSACEAMVKHYFPWTTASLTGLVDVTGGQPWKGAPVLQAATLLRQQFSRRMLYESMVGAMGDQVYVAAFGKCEGWSLNFDNDVIRAHAMGRFSDLLYAALTHPGLLHYLDNDVNGKASPNENLGRELLELHTVGTGHYTETDVRQSALLLTGHSVDDGARRYVFHADQHYVGPVKVMGFSHPNSSAAGGPAVLRAYSDYLAHHPATATRIARRLAVRFVSDQPSDALVADLAARYLSSGTDLAAVLSTLFAHREFASSVGQKWRRPQEWVGAMFAATHPTFHSDQTSADNPYGMLGEYHWLVDGAQHMPRGWPAVNGFPDVSPAWLSSNTTLAGWNAAETVAAGWDKQWASKPWAELLGIKAGQRVAAALESATLRLTGYTWRNADVAALGALITDSDRPPAAGVVLSADDVKYRLTEAVRLILSFPYFFLR